MMTSPLAGSPTTPQTPGFSARTRSAVVGSQSAAGARAARTRISAVRASRVGEVMVRASFGADAAQVAAAAQEDATVGHGGRRLARVAEVAGAQHLELRPRLDGVALAGAGEVEAPVRRRERTRRHGDAGQTLGVDHDAVR